MARSVAELEKEIRSLDRADRVELLRALLDELDGPSDPDVEQAWLEEAMRRYRELESGKVEPIPGDRVFEALRTQMGE